ncbi:MAG: pyridoxal 5'-phosphate synthase glutaminase subunit PdxT [Lentisphaeria bacterium]|nr:pyridoxal 5'-phosphate synthase glutaminase subunit PdxT [Lentisphaeria bacterium]
MIIAVLAVQGDFAEHENIFRLLGYQTVQLRQKSDLFQQFDALVLPGGESTVQGKLLRDLDMFEELRSRIGSGLPVMATCAGTILLAKQLLDDPTIHFGTMNIAVRRNAYGRQLSSFHIDGEFGDLNDVPMSFIRAPQIEFCSPDTEVLSEYQGRITAVRQKNQLAMTFHPELGTDVRIAEYFIRDIVVPAMSQTEKR